MVTRQDAHYCTDRNPDSETPAFVCLSAVCCRLSGSDTRPASRRRVVRATHQPAAQAPAQPGVRQGVGAGGGHQARGHARDVQVCGACLVQASSCLFSTEINEIAPGLQAVHTTWLFSSVDNSLSYLSPYFTLRQERVRLCCWQFFCPFASSARETETNPCLCGYQVVRRTTCLPAAELRHNIPHHVARSRSEAPYRAPRVVPGCLLYQIPPVPIQ